VYGNETPWELIPEAGELPLFLPGDGNDYDSRAYVVQWAMLGDGYYHLPEQLPRLTWLCDGGHPDLCSAMPALERAMEGQERPARDVHEIAHLRAEPQPQWGDNGRGMIAEVRYAGYPGAGKVYDATIDVVYPLAEAFGHGYFLAAVANNRARAGAHLSASEQLGRVMLEKRAFLRDHRATLFTDGGL
jgi:hypothetical protein